jgi:AcrR family transcriptional regulator
MLSRVIIVKNSEAAKKPRGRPPAFDRTEVVGKAAEAFWRLGYEGASIADLTAAMGISPQSLYAAFGSKADLYRETLDWYRTTFVTLPAERLEAAGVLDTLGAWLVVQARLFSHPAHPPGCMVSTGVLACAVENDPVARLVADMREGAIERIRLRLARGQREGELAADADPAALARFVGAIIQGMAVQARDGAPEAGLVAVAELAASALVRHGPAAELANRP